MRRWRCCWRGCRCRRTSRSARRSRVAASAALDDLVGMFVNTVVLRTRVDAGIEFRGSARRGCGRWIWRRSRMRMCRSSGWWRSWRRRGPRRTHPLFQVVLALQNLASARVGVAGAGGVERGGSRSGVAKFDLQLSVAERFGADGVAGGVERRGSPTPPTCSTRRRCARSCSGSCGCWRRWSRIRRCRWATSRCSTAAERAALVPVRGRPGGARCERLAEIFADGGGARPGRGGAARAGTRR